MNSYPKRGDVFWVQLDPTVGSEIKKRRPALIISNNIGNQISSRVIVAPITSSIKKILPFEVGIVIFETKGKILLDQIRSVDKKRLQKNKITSINADKMLEVEEALKVVLSLD